MLCENKWFRFPIKNLVMLSRPEVLKAKFLPRHPINGKHTPYIVEDQENIPWNNNYRIYWILDVLFKKINLKSL